MTELGPQGIPPQAFAAGAERLAGTVLVRIATEPADEAHVARDLAPMLAESRGADLWRIELGRLVAALFAGGLIERQGEQLRPTAQGTAAAAEFLGIKKGLPSRWAAARDSHLMARALGITSPSAAKLKLLRKQEGLRALIVKQHWGLTIKGVPTPSRLRSALAVRALERAFGDQIRDGLGAKAALPAKAGRLLASRLSTSGRELGTDARLVATLAAEAVGARKKDMASLQIALLRRYLGRATDGEAKPSRRRRLGRTRLERHGQAASPVPGTGEAAAAVASRVAAAPQAAAAEPIAASEQGPVAVVSEPVAHARPDPHSFAAAVLAAASATAEGWAGNRKAYISKVWAGVRERHSGWALTEIEFKCMLTEAHRTGLIQLANADLKDKRALRELQDSAVVWKNTVWHYVRAAD
ncbi:MAG: hypothetical protein AB7O57_01420 [Hyphomicrobiaceae bacterium]